MSKKRNFLIEKALKDTGMELHELAHLLGLSEETLSEKLKVLLPLDERIAIAARIRSAALMKRKEVKHE